MDLSVSNDRVLRIEDARDPDVWFELRAPDDLDRHPAILAIANDLRAETTIEISAPWMGLPEFVVLFEEMARDWRGWDGTKAWRSGVGDLELRCMHDRLGHIGIEVDLRSFEFAGAREWRAVGRVTVEAGQLDEIAREAREFFAPLAERPVNR